MPRAYNSQASPRSQLVTTPREQKATSQQATLARTPQRSPRLDSQIEQPDHSPPKLDGLSSHEFYESGDSKKSEEYHRPLSRHDTAEEASSILSMLIANFSKLHTSNALILAKLQIPTDDSFFSQGGHTSPKASPDIPRYSNNIFAQATSSTTGSKSSKRTSFPNSWSLQTSLASRFKSNPGTTKSMESLPENDAVNVGSVSIRTSVTSKFSIISNRAGMEKLAQIINSHSKHFERKGSTPHKVWEFLENRTSSRWAYYYGSYFAPFFLIVSVLLSFLQSVDEWALPEDVSSVIQMTFESWFATEIAIRFLVCPDKIVFWCSAFNWIDFVSVSPLSLRIYMWANNAREDHLQRVIALVPMMRLLKILRRFHKFQLLVSAFSIALEALPVLIFSLMLIAIMFSGLMYLVESRELIPDLPSACWFVMVTMTTVGYGDIVPETMTGKAFSAFLMVLSALYMALPIGIVGNAFSEVWKDRDRLLLLAVLRESFVISGISRSLIREIFEQFTSDGVVRITNSDPEMNLADFQKMISALQIDVPEDRAVALFNALDEDGSGNISCDEFLHKLFPVQFLNRKTIRHATSMFTASYDKRFSQAKSAGTVV